MRKLIFQLNQYKGNLLIQKGVTFGLEKINECVEIFEERTNLVVADNMTVLNFSV